MRQQVSWKIGGQQGDGIDVTGEVMAKALNRLGFYLYGYRHFSSRIKGGHTNFKIRAAAAQVRTIADKVDMLVAFDQETIDINYREIKKGGIIIADSNVNLRVARDCEAELYPIPLTEIASKLGNSLVKDMVAVGAASAFLGLGIEVYESVIEDLFGWKGRQVVKLDMEAIRLGTEFVKGQSWSSAAGLQLIWVEKKQRLFMTGNDAIALGALVGGARLMAAYPITPASGIMETLFREFPEVGGAVIQAEDEIAACTMAIGANYAGVRAFTASSGPGLSLMAESIGLAGMTETPLVIVNVQRGGPSTGLATKQEQSDLMAMIYGTHGEIPKVVMAPSTVEEAFYDTAEAFNIAEEYQCPVILLSDLQLALGNQTVDRLEYDKVKIRRGSFDINAVLPTLGEKGYFKRYQVTADGISPRTVPGMKNGIHHVTGLEHDETGKPSEQPQNHKTQMDKRLRKLESLPVRFNIPIYKNAPHAEADLLIVGFGSTRGAIEEAVSRLVKDGMKVNHAHIRLMHPFPVEELQPLIGAAKKVVIVEQNATGQLAAIIRTNIVNTENLVSLLKYDGNPLRPAEVYAKCKGLI